MEKNPLSSKWCFWYTSFLKNFSYGPLSSYFSTIEDFWKIYYLIPSSNPTKKVCPLDSIVDGGISLFKDGIQPIENDEKNKYRFITKTNDSELFMKFIKYAISGKIDSINSMFNGVYSSRKKAGDKYLCQVELWFDHVGNIDELRTKLEEEFGIKIIQVRQCKKISN